MQTLFVSLLALSLRWRCSIVDSHIIQEMETREIKEGIKDGSLSIARLCLSLSFQMVLL